MNKTVPKTVADSTLPLLVTLVTAKKQAMWQWKHAAPEHSRKWILVIERLEERIKTGDRMVAERLEIPGYRTKRVIVK